MADNPVLTREFSLTSGDDTSIKISLGCMLDHFQCPICKCTIFNASLTTCGHRYCKLCIAEWIGRSHECPVCRSPLSQDEIISDKLFDELLDTIAKERKKEEDEHYRQAAIKTSEAAVSSGSNKPVSPLETVLRKHLKKTLQTHEEYHQQVVSECKKSQSRAYREKSLKIDKVLRSYPHDPDHPERVRQMKQIEVDWDNKMKSLENELIRIQSLLTTTYDKYLEKNLPSPSTLPITVKLSVPQKGFVANNVVIKPSDRMNDILKKLHSLMEADRIDIVEFPSCEELQISLLSPFANNKYDDNDNDDDGLGKSVKMKNSAGVSGADDVGLTSLINTTLHGDCRPVLEFGLKPGSEIRIEGAIILEGEQPRVCYAASFTKGQSRSVDYFICQTCNNTTWICQNCANVCHKDHELMPHRMNHVSTWACCYCYRKTQCFIFNK